MNAEGVCVEAFSQMEKYKKPTKPPQTPHMKPSIKIEIYMFLMQEFSLNELAELKSVISLKQNS